MHNAQAEEWSKMADKELASGKPIDNVGAVLGALIGGAAGLVGGVSLVAVPFVGHHLAPHAAVIAAPAGMAGGALVGVKISKGIREWFNSL
jgi:hypothetical protein